MAAGAVPPRGGTPGPRVGGSAPAKHARGCAVLMAKGGGVNHQTTSPRTRWAGDKVLLCMKKASGCPPMKSPAGMCRDARAQVGKGLWYPDPPTVRPKYPLHPLEIQCLVVFRWKPSQVRKGKPLRLGNLLPRISSAWPPPRPSRVMPQKASPADMSPGLTAGSRELLKHGGRREKPFSCREAEEASGTRTTTSGEPSPPTASPDAGFRAYLSPDS